MGDCSLWYSNTLKHLQQDHQSKLSSEGDAAPVVLLADDGNVESQVGQSLGAAMWVVFESSRCLGT